METKFSKKYIIWICLLLILASFNFSACGKKGPPRPPVQEKPHSIVNFYFLR
jgi:predicted small lipoprotein YifL